MSHNLQDMPEGHVLEHHESAFSKKDLWRTFWILLGITIVDIVLYYMLLEHHSLAKNIMFVALGLIKAYFIVGVFMHMKYERLTLALIILVPIIFIIGLIMGLLYEGDFWSTI